MPLYEFNCKACDKRFEKLMHESDPIPPCPKCGATDVSREVSSFTSTSCSPGGG